MKVSDCCGAKLKEIEIKQKTSNINDETEFISFLYNAIG